MLVVCGVIDEAAEVNPEASRKLTQGVVSAEFVPFVWREWNTLREEKKLLHST